MDRMQSWFSERFYTKYMAEKQTIVTKKRIAAELCLSG
jgi:hypothetical protein